MPYLFDTSALSEVLRPRPDEGFTRWVRGLPRAEQFTSSVAIGELYSGAFRTGASAKWLRFIEEDVLSTITVLEFDLRCAREFGRLRARLKEAGTPVGDADTMIGATAIVHGLELVTANVRHFRRITELSIRPVLQEELPDPG